MQRRVATALRAVNGVATSDEQDREVWFVMGYPPAKSSPRPQHGLSMNWPAKSAPPCVTDKGATPARASPVRSRSGYSALVCVATGEARRLRQGGSAGRSGVLPLRVSCLADLPCWTMEWRRIAFAGSAPGAAAQDPRISAELQLPESRVPCHRARHGQSLLLGINGHPQYVQPASENKGKTELFGGICAAWSRQMIVV
jgi:hypothetical protein